MLRWPLIAALSLLIGCSAPEPDVSAFTILTLMVQTEGEPEAARAALGSLYEEVVPWQGYASAGSARSFSFRLGRGEIAQGQAERARLTCHAWDAPLRKLGWQYPDPFRTEMWHPLQGTQRVMCFFTYFDRPRALETFALHARMWADVHLGPVYSNPRADPPRAWVARPDGAAFPVLHVQTPKTRWWRRTYGRLILVHDF